MAQDATARDLEEARQLLIEAEQDYQRSRVGDYLTRHVRDSAIVEAHRAGMSSREISDLLGGLGQPNVVRARRRSLLHEELVPGGMLSPTGALRASGLSVGEFVEEVRSGRLEFVEVGPGVRAFRADDIRGLAGRDKRTPK